MGVRVVVLLYWLHVIFAPVLSDVWKAELEPNMDALVSSCVVLPCSFKYPGKEQPSSRMRAIWHKEKINEEYIYSEDNLKIMDSFKGRTRMVGRLGDYNCSLEIDDVKNHDNGPFCFRVELERAEKDKYSFIESCVSVNLNENQDKIKPELQFRQSVEEGVPVVFKCSVMHTCPSHHPTLTWSRPEKDILLSYKDIRHGNWEVESLLTITPKKEDDHKDITCTVKYHGGLEASSTVSIYVREQATLSHILIPTITGLVVSALFGGLCFFMVKKYKKRIQELQSNNDNGMWNRLSRMSRRFRPGENRNQQGGRDQRRGQGHQIDSNIDNGKNNVCTVSGGKPRMPSPKRQKPTLVMIMRMITPTQLNSTYMEMPDRKHRMSLKPLSSSQYLCFDAWHSCG
ncbi:sialic acid-binding Ig-like lectin 14 isoform X2 [Xyrauchen texanus]|uniref:sialic acid-binding Ig-like lectin 14 isoform X2 n=1 Tax=Xyrauchen texanus TaxID=154827 RepID=UPI002241FB6C|nr:sialic acid-binding Ig-like lectin 14 isoform X2 [Xyrauchen texanus]